MRTEATNDAPGERSPRTERLQHLDRAHLDRVRELTSAATTADGYPALSEQILLSLEATADGNAPVGAPISILTWSSDGSELWGCATVTRDETGWRVETVVDPAHRDGPTDLWRQLLETALGEIATLGGGRVSVWVRAPRPQDATTLAAVGLEPERTMLQLRMGLVANAPPDRRSPPFEVSAFRPGSDESEWLRVNARAFASHPEQGSWTLSDLAQRERAPWFDPGGFLLHRSPGRAGGRAGPHVGRGPEEHISAFCWTKIHRSPLLGEIYVIGVDPDNQGRGFGRAILLAGLAHLASRSVPTAMLYCESTNEPALVLYRSIGFTEHHHEVAFTGDVVARRSPDDADR